MRIVRRRVGGRQRGQVLILFALGAVALVSFAALAIDGGNVYVNRRVAQTAADTAALAAARALSQTTSSTGQDVAAAGCMYGRTNRWGGWTSVSTLEYVGTDGLPGGLGHALPLQANVFSGSNSCPTPSTTVCTKPPMSSCGITAAQTNLIPLQAAGVHVRTTQTFTPYFAGILGIQTFTVTADATATVQLLTTYAADAPFIACGANMTPEDDTNNRNSIALGGANNNKWSDITNATVKILATGTGPYVLNTTLWRAVPPGPRSEYPAGSGSFDASALLAAPAGTKPVGPSFNIHGTAVKGTCNTSSNWKGLSCVADTSCPVPPNPAANRLLLNLPNVNSSGACITPPGGHPCSQLADGTNGNKNGLAANTVGPNGCGVGVAQQCIAILPIAVDGDGGDNLWAVAWGAFWLDHCYGYGGGGPSNNATCAWFIGASYTLTGGASYSGWTFGGGKPSGVLVVKLVS